MNLEKLHLCHKNIREIYLEVQRDGVIKYISSNCIEILGYEEKFMVGKNFNDFSEQAINFTNLTMENNILGKYINIKNKSGDVLHMDYEYSIQFDNYSKDYISFSLIDVTKYAVEEEKLKGLVQIFEKSNDVIYALDVKPKPNYVYLSPAIEKNLGYTREENMKNPLLACDIVHPDYKDIQVKKMTGEIDYSKRIVTPYKHKISGEYIWYEDYIIPIYDKLGNITRIYGICRNIQESKELVDRLTYLSYHDALTGVFNRAYFENEMEKLNKSINKMAIIICDLDNLKKLNDKKGHDFGDEIIKETGKILKEFFGEKGIVSRIGGDEFGIILSDISDAKVEEYLHNLKSKISQYNNNKYRLKINLSMGYGYTNNSLSKVSKVFKVADKNMYNEKVKNKLKESLKFNDIAIKEIAFTNSEEEKERK